jgi:hypothetical protein
MNGKKARKIRKFIYGDDSPLFRHYVFLENGVRINRGQLVKLNSPQGPIQLSKRVLYKKTKKSGLNFVQNYKP